MTGCDINRCADRLERTARRRFAGAMRHLIPPEAEAQLGPFTLAQARAVGWTPDALRHACATGMLLRLRPGVFGTPPSGAYSVHQGMRSRLTLDAAAACLRVNHSVISHSAAGALHGLPLLTVPDVPCITVPPRWLGDVEDAHLHRAGLPEHHLAAEPGGHPLTSAARTVVDIAREHCVSAGVVTGDAALRLGRTTALELHRIVRDCRGWPGVRRARAAAELIDPGAESPLESLSRVHIAQHGLPRPTLQKTITDRGGRFVGRVDFWWEPGVVGEADGLEKYTSMDVLHAEKLRQERLEELGLRVVRWGWTDLARFDIVAARLRRALLPT